MNNKITIAETTIKGHQLRLTVRDEGELGEVLFTIDGSVTMVKGMTKRDKFTVCRWWLKEWEEWVEKSFPGLPTSIECLFCYPAIGDGTDRRWAYMKRGWKETCDCVMFYPISSDGGFEEDYYDPDPFSWVG